MCTKVGANSWKMGTLPDVFRAWTQCAGKDGAMFALRAVKEQACGQQDVILGYWDIYIYMECSKLQGAAPNPCRKLKSTAMQTYG